MKIEVTLVWKDGGKTQALVPMPYDGPAPEEVTCGTSRFHRDRSARRPTYVEKDGT